MGKFWFIASQLGFFAFKPLPKEKFRRDKQRLNFQFSPPVPSIELSSRFKKNGSKFTLNISEAICI